MLRLENVGYRYRKGKRDVLNKVSAEFKSGFFTSIIGSSGSGKTTLLSILAGLDRPSSGKIFIGKANLATLNLDYCRRERISVIFQAFHLFPLLTALENVCYPMEQNGIRYKEAKVRAAELLESVGIAAEKHKRYPANLSGGEQQRVAIARALSTGSKLILADEPTGNLDKANGDAIVEILQRLAHEKNYCVVVVTHNPEIAEASDAVYRMADGVLTAVK